MNFITLLGKLLEYFVRFTTWGSCYFSWDNTRWDEFLSSRYGWVVTNQNTDITLVHSWLIEVWQFANYIWAEYDYTPLGTSISPKDALLSRWFSFSPAGIYEFPGGYSQNQFTSGTKALTPDCYWFLHNSTGCSWTTPSFSCFWLVSYIFPWTSFAPKRLTPICHMNGVLLTRVSGVHAVGNRWQRQDGDCSREGGGILPWGC